MNKLHLVAAALAVTGSSLAFADGGVSDYWDIPTASNTTRAEVRAETMMWKRSGMATLTQLDSYNPYSAETRQARATFARLMNGPEYTAELRRQQGSTSTAAAPAERSGD